MPLPLNVYSGLHYGNHHGAVNACWDGRYFWLASPSIKAGEILPVDWKGKYMSVAVSSGKEAFLAVIEPKTQQTWMFTSKDGLPPMHINGGAAVTALAPGKICVAGYFRRSWCGLATFDPVAGKKLDIFYEAREVEVHGVPEKDQNLHVASPIIFLCTLASSAAKGTPSQQRVLLGRERAFPLLLDPQKRTVEAIPYRIPDYTLFYQHDGA